MGKSEISTKVSNFSKICAYNFRRCRKIRGRKREVKSVLVGWSEKKMTREKSVV